MSETGVYILATMNGADYCGPVKIGFATDPRKRLGSLQSGNPHRLRIVFYFPLPYRELARLVEQSFHKKMKRRGLVGECYDLAPATAIRLLCSSVREHCCHLVSRSKGSEDELRGLLESSGVRFAEERLGIISRDELRAAMHG